MEILKIEKGLHYPERITTDKGVFEGQSTYWIKVPSAKEVNDKTLYKIIRARTKWDFFNCPRDSDNFDQLQAAFENTLKEKKEKVHPVLKVKGALLKGRIDLRKQNYFLSLFGVKLINLFNKFFQKLLVLIHKLSTVKHKVFSVLTREIFKVS